MYVKVTVLPTGTTGPVGLLLSVPLVSFTMFTPGPRRSGDRCPCRSPWSYPEWSARLGDRRADDRSVVHVLARHRKRGSGVRPGLVDVQPAIPVGVVAQCRTADDHALVVRHLDARQRNVPGIGDDVGKVTVLPTATTGPVGLLLSVPLVSFTMFTAGTAPKW